MIGAAVCRLAVVACTIAVATAQEFDWNRLLSRPDLWPAQVTMQLDSEVQGQPALAKGTVVDVDELRTDGLVMLMAGNPVPASVPPRGTDALALARATFAALTEAQRRLDPTTMAKRAELWPDQAELLRPMTVFAGGKDRIVPKGTKVAVGSFDGEYLRVGGDVVPYGTRVRMHFTDFAASVRKALETEADQHPMRVLRELQGRVRLRGGPKTAGQAAAPALLVLYFAAASDRDAVATSDRLEAFFREHKKQIARASRASGSAATPTKPR